ncbi:acyltransferase [Noviherbaspirillum cavernae]|uniref:Acyltransferase n=2 Tax=Noviherbaspirillum cavernae TaxID=2320862 RepID=A0A418X5G7_9BURK|nr:acyltransferase [Noviherbaspirillum cavernae]
MAARCFIPKLRHFLYRRSGLPIGDRTFVNMGLTVVDDYKNLVTIGSRVAVAPNVTLIASSDPNNSWLARIERLSKCQAIKLEDDCWIGAGAIIMPGVVVGEKAIVAAGAVVTKSIGPGEIHAGVPARRIGDIKDYIA